MATADSGAVKPAFIRAGMGARAAIAEISHFSVCSHPLTGCIAGENEGVKPHVLCAFYTFGFVCWLVQLFIVLVIATCFIPLFQLLHQIYQYVKFNMSTILMAKDNSLSEFNTLITSFDRNHNPYDKTTYNKQ